MARTVFPFTALVGQALMKRALLLNAVRPDIGGVLIRGERGTAKSTAARGLAALLPDVRVVADCPFGCDPAARAALCDACRARVEAGEALPEAVRRTPFVDLPVSATEDRVVGTLDIERVLASGRRHFEPGLLAAANRGVLYVDEVNLLDDHVVDVLLDAAAMGTNIVEREGVSFSHPARFVLVGTMNPEEGELRPQLTDRFGLSVEVRAAGNVAERTEIMRRRLAFDAAPEPFARAWAAEEARWCEAVVAARAGWPAVGFTDRDLHLIAQIVEAAGVDGHRADLTILKAAQAQAALERRQAIDLADLRLAAHLALGHRLRRGPFESGEGDWSAVDGVLERAEPGPAAGGHSRAEGPPAAGRSGGGADGGASVMPGAGAAMAGADGAGRPQVGEARPPGRPAEPAAVMEESFEVRRLDARLDRLVRKPAGRRSVTRSKTRRGRYVWAVPAESGRDDIAVDATLRAAALRQAPLPPGAGLQVTVQDLQRKVRMRRAGNVILFLVDASWSMATAGRLAAAKGAVLSLLVDAYQRRDRVGMAVFRRTGTDVVLPFTASVLQARRLLASIPVGGKTPLSHGLYTADELFRRVLRHDPTQLPLLVLLTDGAGNISLSGRPPTEETLLLADRIRRQGVRSVVIDLYSRVQLQPVSPAAALARALGGEHTSVESLHAGGVLEAVRARLDPLA